MTDDAEIFYPLAAAVEDIEEYRPGGYHPLYLNDVLHEGRYLVLRKLGYGSYSTTWLARDRKLSRFVAIKIKKANDSDSHEISIYDNLAVGDAYGTKAHVIELIDHFTIQGPNGSHSCLAFPALGPSIIDVLHLSPSAGIGAEADFDKSTRLSISAARKILLQALMGLDHLHRQNIIHGDFHGGNWLLELQDINRLSDTDIAQYPKKISEPVRRLDGKENTGDPRHLTRNDPLYKWIATAPDLGVRIVDLGSAFYAGEAPNDPHTAIDVRSPELLLTKKISSSQDVWSFGCIMYKFFTSITLFSLFDMGNLEALNDSHVLQMIELLGPLPNNLKYAWSNYDQYFDEHDVQTRFRNKWSPEYDALSSQSSLDEEGNGNVNGASEAAEPGTWDEDAVRLSDSTLPDYLVPSLVEIYESKPLGIDDVNDDSDTYTPDLPLAPRFMRDKHPDMLQEEAEAVVDLLHQIFRYNPAERPTTAELLRHPWIVKFCQGEGNASPQGPPPNKRRRLAEPTGTCTGDEEEKTATN